jgi:hypothetical protein
MSMPIFDTSLKGRLGGHSFKSRRNSLIERIRRSHPILSKLRVKNSELRKKRIWLNLTKNANLRADAAELERDRMQAQLAISNSIAPRAAILACVAHFQEAWEHVFIECPEQDMIDVTTAIRNFAEIYQGSAESDWKDDDARPAATEQDYRALQSQHDDLQSMLFNVKRERDELMGLIKAVAAHSTPTLINGTRCAAFPWIEYEVVAAKAKGGAA